MAFGKGILAGKKTYVLAVMAALSATAGYLIGEIGTIEYLHLLFEAGAAATIRHGIQRLPWQGK